MVLILRWLLTVERLLARRDDRVWLLPIHRSVARKRQYWLDAFIPDETRDVALRG